MCKIVTKGLTENVFIKDLTIIINILSLCLEKGRPKHSDPDP